jgi:hypothetical protein
VGPRRGRIGRVALAAWIVGLTAVIGLAGWGSWLAPTQDRRPSPTGPSSSAPDPRSSAPHAVAAATPNARAAPPLVAPTRWIFLTWPAEQRTVATSRSLPITGYSVPPVATVEVRLLSAGSRIVARDTFVPVTRSPLGNDERYWFSTRIGLPSPRPNGTMWVVVIGYDGDGQPLDAVRRDVEVGPLVVGDAEQSLTGAHEFER